MSRNRPPSHPRTTHIFKLMLEVYFEGPCGYAECIGIFSQWIYAELLPTLEEIAKKHNFEIVTEKYLETDK